jgi:hypothetical protein
MAKRGLQFEVLVPAEVCVALVDPRTDNSPNNSVSLHDTVYRLRHG